MCSNALNSRGKREIAHHQNLYLFVYHGKVFQCFDIMYNSKTESCDLKKLYLALSLTVIYIPR